MTTQWNTAVIVDNRDGTRETVAALGISVHLAKSAAFAAAAEHCNERNAVEGWSRFVPLR